MTDTTLTKGKEVLAEELGKLLAETPLPEEMKRIFLERMDTVSEQHVVALIRWLRERNHEAQELVDKLVQLQKDNDADWKALEKEQHKDMVAFIDEQVAAAQREAETDELLAKADDTDAST